MADSLV
jgi:hypothetical protein